MSGEMICLQVFAPIFGDIHSETQTQEKKQLLEGMHNQMGRGGLEIGEWHN